MVQKTQNAKCAT